MVCLVNQTPYQLPLPNVPYPRHFDIFGAYQPIGFPLRPAFTSSSPCSGNSRIRGGKVHPPWVWNVPWHPPMCRSNCPVWASNSFEVPGAERSFWVFVGFWVGEKTMGVVTWGNEQTVGFLRYIWEKYYTLLVFFGESKHIISLSIKQPVYSKVRGFFFSWLTCCWQKFTW